MTSAPLPTTYPYVEHKPGVRAGQPVIVGTRIPVATIVRSHQLGMDIDEILVEYPSLEPQHVHAALLYYLDHRAEIDAILEEAEHPPAGSIELGR
jgi:uncharacterized protein (DUF433 family)